MYVHVCTSSCVYKNVCTHVITVYLIAVAVKMFEDASVRFQYMEKSES